MEIHGCSSILNRLRSARLKWSSCPHTAVDVVSCGEKPGSAGKMKELTAIDCKLQDRTSELVEKFKDRVQFDEATGVCKVDDKDFKLIESAINSFNKMEGSKNVE